MAAHTAGADLEASNSAIGVAVAPETVRPFSRRAGTDRIEATLLRCLERLHGGLVVLDDGNRIEFANSAARRALKGRSSIVIRRNRLLTSDDRLQRLIGQCGQRPKRIEASWTIELRDAHLPTDTQSIIISGHTGRRANDPLVLQLVMPRESRQGAPRALREVYGLTAAETGLVQQLVFGKPLADAAADLHVSVHTARTHLKKIFAKCEVRSQTELMRLVMSLPDPAF